MNRGIWGNGKLGLGLLVACVWITWSQVGVAEPAKRLTKAGEACVERFSARLERVKKAVADLDRLAKTPTPAGLSADEAAAYEVSRADLAGLVKELNGLSAQIDKSLAAATEAGREVNFLLDQEYELRGKGAPKRQSKEAELDEQVRQAVWQVHQGEK